MLRSQRSYRSSGMEGGYTSTEVHRGISTAARGGPTPAHAGRSPPHSAAAIVHQHFHSGPCISLWSSLSLSLSPRETRFHRLNSLDPRNCSFLSIAAKKNFQREDGVSPSPKLLVLESLYISNYISLVFVTVVVGLTNTGDRRGEDRQRSTNGRRFFAKIILHRRARGVDLKILKAESTKWRWKRELASNDGRLGRRLDEERASSSTEGWNRGWIKIGIISE